MIWRGRYSVFRGSLAMALLLLGYATSCPAESEFAQALAQRDAQPLDKIESDGPSLMFRKEMVLLTIKIARGQRVGIERQAAAELDKLFEESAATVEREPEGSRNRELLAANEVRFVARLISLATPQASGHSEVLATITQESVRNLRRELDQRISGFCPCWPFCK